jgi:hypothetical protein
MSRSEFPLSVRKQAWARANGICECGCERAFGDHPKERPHYDHELPDFLGGCNDLENCKVIRVDCHQAKTAGSDISKIVKVRREDKRRSNLTAPKKKIPGSKGSGFRRKMDGTVVKVSE